MATPDGYRLEARLPRDVRQIDLPIVILGAIIFSAVLLFQIVTLPVEFDASARAKKLAIDNGLILPPEREGMDRVLNAAAVVSSQVTVVYYLFRAGVLGNRSAAALPARHRRHGSRAGWSGLDRR